MNKDIRIDLSFSTHRKRKKLFNLLGAPGVLALIDLWASCARSRPKGVLIAMDEVDIALDAGWSGDGKQFCRALLDVGFLDQDQQGVYSIHDWREHQPFCFFSDERSELSRKAAEARWTKKHGKVKGAAKRPQDASMRPACDRHTGSNAPIPSPTPSPSPSPSPTPSPTPIPEKIKAFAPSDPQNGSLEALLNSNRENFSKAYPGIDLDIEVAKAKAWLLSNPKNKKSNLRRYLNSWFNRAQEKINRFPRGDEGSLGWGSGRYSKGSHENSNPQRPSKPLLIDCRNCGTPMAVSEVLKSDDGFCGKCRPGPKARKGEVAAGETSGGAPS